MSPFLLDFFPFSVTFCPPPKTLFPQHLFPFSVLQKKNQLCFLLQVPSKKNVKVRFNMFFVLEPGIPISSCTKDYVQINNTR